MNGEDKMIQITFKRQRKGVGITEIEEKWEGNGRIALGGAGCHRSRGSHRAEKLHSPPSVPKKLTWQIYIQRKGLFRKNDGSEGKETVNLNLVKLFFKINLERVPRAMNESPGEWLSPGLSFSLQHFKPHFSWKVGLFPQMHSHQGPCVSKAMSVLLSAPSSSCSFSSAGDTAAEYSQNWKMSLLLEESQLLPAWN